MGAGHWLQAEMRRRPAASRGDGRIFSSGAGFFSLGVGRADDRRINPLSPMKRPVPPTLFGLFLLLLALPLAAAMNNGEVIKMQKAGLSEATMISAMQQGEGDFDTGPDALIELKAAGVPDAVIREMIALKAGGSPRQAGPAATGPSGGFLQEFPSIAPARISPVAGSDYFTRHAFWEEKGEFNTTNYSRGVLVPINTRVKVVALSGSKFVLKRLDTGQQVKVRNEEKFTRKSMSEIAALLLSAGPTPLEKLPEDVATAVRSGEMRKGMTRELVLMTRGFPPAHETPSLDGGRWVYWSSRFVKQTILFNDGRLAEGRGLY
jgi:hypothetical protein